MLIARDFLGDDDFVMYLGDNMLQQGLSDFVAAFEHDKAAAATPTLDGEVEPPAAQILLCPVPDPHRFGVAAIDEDGHVVQLVEKPEDPPSDLALVGVYLFTPAIHEAVAAIEPSPRGELEITDAIQWLIDHGHRVRHDMLERMVARHRQEGPAARVEPSGARDPGAPHRRRRSTRTRRSTGRVVVEEGAEIIASHIRGPAIIGAGTRIERTYVGPFTAIAAGCEVTDSEVEHSVVLERAEIDGVPRLTDSLIGRDTRVHRSGRRPSSTRLMIGDDCTIDLE